MHRLYQRFLALPPGSLKDTELFDCVDGLVESTSLRHMLCRPGLDRQARFRMSITPATSVGISTRRRLRDTYLVARKEPFVRCVPQND